MGFLRRIGFLLAFVNGALFAQQIVRPADQPQKYSAKFTDITTKLGVNFQYLSSHTAKHYLGANFGDIDNDGFLDIYLGTGGPEYGFLMPKVLLRNHEGKVFCGHQFFVRDWRPAQRTWHGICRPAEYRARRYCDVYGWRHSWRCARRAGLRESRQ